MLSTSPCKTGSSPVAKTMGMVVVAALAAKAATVPPAATIMVTWRRTNSAASAGSLSSSFSAQRYSIVTFTPSTWPVSFRPWRNARRRSANVSADAEWRNPIAGCCARAASGQAAAMPPSKRNSRRRMPDTRAPPRSRSAASSAYHQPTWQVLGADLNCSESRRGAAGRFPPEPLISAPLRAARQAEGEDRTLAQLACHCHIAAHHPRELTRDSEPEPRSPEALSGRGIGLAELLEQLCLLLRGHPDAGVGDGELDDVAAIAHFACRKLDLARFGELTRIAQQVQEYLP